MQIVWTRQAVINLHQIREFICLDNPTAAANVGARIESATLQLMRFPDSGRPGKVKGTREIAMPTLPYIIIYRVKGDEVQILRVLHTKQKWRQPS